MSLSAKYSLEMHRPVFSVKRTGDGLSGILFLLNLEGHPAHCFPAVDFDNGLESFFSFPAIHIGVDADVSPVSEIGHFFEEGLC